MRRQATREGLLRAEADRRRSGRAAHAARARGHPRRGAARRGRTCSPASPWRCSGQVPWRAVPAMPVEIMLLPRWFPFHLAKVSYWSRTVIVPLLILMALKPQARNPRGIGIRELFVTPPASWSGTTSTNPTGAARSRGLHGASTGCCGRSSRRFPRIARERAIEAARATSSTSASTARTASAPSSRPWPTPSWPSTRSGYAPRRSGRRVTPSAADAPAHRRSAGRRICQPCLSPRLGHGARLHAMMEAGEPPDGARRRRALAGSPSARSPTSRATGPGTGRTSPRAAGPSSTPTPTTPTPTTRRSSAWRCTAPIRERHRPGDRARPPAGSSGCRARDGGWGAFDADNTNHYLNHIPFADHGALLDPPTVDVTARCLGLLAQIGYGPDHPVIAARRRLPQGRAGARRLLVRPLGRRTTSTAPGRRCAPSTRWARARSRAAVRRAVDWLEARQRDDGGWGEDRATYWEDRRNEAKADTPSQTAWALLGLMAAGEVESAAVARGVAFLEAHRATARAGRRSCGRRSASPACSTSSTTATAPTSRSGRSAATGS